MDILLVEDNVCDAELTLRELHKHHLSNKIYAVRDGAQAIDFISSNDDLGLVLLDLQLPKVSGFEVLQSMQGNPKTKHILAVILSGSMESPDLLESYRLGARSCMVKPVDFAKLVDMVRQLGFEWSLANPTVSRRSAESKQPLRVGGQISEREAKLVTALEEIEVILNKNRGTYAGDDSITQAIRGIVRASLNEAARTHEL